ncbi:UNVERIFIED_CONTAM: hypothetical protein ABIC26_000313 [Paenibacillus sp. PvR008]
MESILKTSKSGDLSVNYSLDTFHQKFGELMQDLYQRQHEQGSGSC